MIRKFITLPIAMTAFSIIGMQTQAPVCEKVIPIHLPQNTIIAFDLDEVVLTGREPGYLKFIGENPDLAQAIDATKKKYNLFDAMEIIDKTIKDYPELKEKAEQFRDKVIKAEVIPGTIKIINQLNKKGYTIIAASNMTPSTYQAMVDNKTLPAAFSKTFFFVATSTVKKPSIQYYQDMITYINKQFPGKFKHFIFTDDKLENAEGAAKVKDLNSIHFKNPEQLAQDLKNLGIDLD